MHKDKPVPHVHAEVIKQWASGEQIQFSFNNTEWRDCSNNAPTWDIRNFYRVKPKPPKNIELYANAEMSNAEMYKGTDLEYAVNAHTVLGNFSLKFIPTDNLKLTFCGVTGKLLSAEVVVHPSNVEDNNDI